MWMSLRLGERRAGMISKRKMGFQRVTRSKCLEVYRLSGGYLSSFTNTAHPMNFTACECWRGGKLRVWLFIGAAAVSEAVCVCHFTVNWFRSGTVSLHQADT